MFQTACQLIILILVLIAEIAAIARQAREDRDAYDLSSTIIAAAIRILLTFILLYGAGCLSRLI